MATDRKIRIFVTLVVALTALTTVFLTVNSLANPAATGARTLGAYALVRNAVLLAALIWALLRRAWHPLTQLLWLEAAIQLGDTIVGITAHSLSRTLGPAFFALALTAAVLLVRPLRHHRSVEATPPASHAEL
jgi:hypothetical protein